MTTKKASTAKIAVAKRAPKGRAKLDGAAKQRGGVGRKAAPRNGGGGKKTDIIVKLASRKQGVTGTEIMEACEWPSGSAKWRVEHLAASRGMKAKQVNRPDGAVAYALVTK